MAGLLQRAAAAAAIIDTEPFKNLRGGHVLEDQFPIVFSVFTLIVSSLLLQRIAATWPRLMFQC